jgi:hypothetical protein
VKRSVPGTTTELVSGQAPPSAIVNTFTPSCAAGGYGALQPVPGSGLRLLLDCVQRVSVNATSTEAFTATGTGGVCHVAG